MDTDKSKEAMKLALEALESYKRFIDDAHIIEGQWHWIAGADQAQVTLKARLAEHPAQQEPVAWGIVASNTGRICQVVLDADEVEGHNPKHIVPLYTSPPAQRTWVGLTNNELQPIADEYRILFGSWVEDFARAMEAKLKAKNFA